MDYLRRTTWVVLAAIFIGAMVFLLTQVFGGLFLRTAANPGVTSESSQSGVCRRYCFVETPDQPGYSHRLCQAEFRDGTCARYQDDIADKTLPECQVRCGEDVAACSGYDLELDGSSVLVKNGQWDGCGVL